jgi:hypothetical protein
MTASFRLQLLVRPNHRIDRQDRRDEPGVLHIANHRRDHGGDHQNVNERTDELAKHYQPERRGPCFRQNVQAMFGQSPFDFLGRKSRRGAA